MIAKVAVSDVIFSIDRPYDYHIPEELASLAIPGMRALVSFGRGNRKSEGVILSVASVSQHKKLKSIDSLLDETPIYTEENIKLALWMSDRFFCTVFDALRIMLPTGMWARDGTIGCSDKTMNFACLAVDAEEAMELAAQKAARAPQQAAVLKELAINGDMSVKDLTALTDAKSGSIKALEKLGVLYLENREVLRRPSINEIKTPTTINLNIEQTHVLNNISPLLEESSPQAALLYGVTGSGKTMVYIKLIEKTIELGKTAIVLVPEISLTPQVMSIFASYFGDAVAVLHSALSVGERFDEWKRVRGGDVRVVVGTRSAIFAPLSNLGLIVIDEEQEHTYKSELCPRYHARDIAKFRVTKWGATLLLASATPSIESMYYAKIGNYRLFHLKSRFNEKDLPNVIITDMKTELKNGNSGCISSVLREEIKTNIEKGEQSILFINRRGTSPIVSCGECGYTFQCMHCSITLTYHKLGQRLICHYCGYSRMLPPSCADCGGKLKFIGAGTQKTEAELSELFPEAKIIRMDADSVTRKNSHGKLLSDFRNKNAHILLGTQMVTKGLDFENVTLVGVVSADASLYMGDYRAHERTFSLITQVVGRSGRGDKPGRAIIQTFTPAHEVIKLSSKQDYDNFFDREIAMRKIQNSPPISDLLIISASALCEETVLASCKTIRNSLKGYFRDEPDVKILGPAPAPVFKANNKFRYRLLISCINTKKVRETIAHTLREFSRGKFGKKVSIFVDCEP